MPRHTIYLSDKVAELLGPTDNLSGRINSIIIRYHAVTAEECPSLSEGEWCFICDMLNGTFIEDTTANYLWADITEAGNEDGLAEKWDVDTHALSVRVRAMTKAETWAILDVVARFWKSPKPADASHADRLREAGAKIA